MHNLDAADRIQVVENVTTDEERKGFWELFQIGYFFRLFLDKQPTTTIFMDQWKVNLPYLTKESVPDGGVEPVIFAVNSRMTSIISDYFELIERSSSEQSGSILSEVEKLCTDARNLFEEWQLVSLKYENLYA